MTDKDTAIDTAEQIYMSFGDNEIEEAVDVLNNYAESYHSKKCAECYHKQFTRFEPI